MTPNQIKERIMAYLAESMDDRGYAPTYREIGAHIGLKSTSTVCRYIRRLESEGKISAGKMTNRAVAVRRGISVNPEDRTTARRIRLEIADGGSLTFDCNFSKVGEDGVTLSFSGILDASQLKSEVGRVVGCTTEGENAAWI